MPYADKEKRQAYRREWVENNREKVRASARDWAANHRDKVRADRQARRAANPEKHRADWKDYYERNKAKVLEKNTKYALANPERMRAYSKKSASKPETKAKIAEWQRQHPERRKESHRKFATSEKGKEFLRAYNAEYRKTDKYRARMVANTLKIREYALACYHRHRTHYKEYMNLYGGAYPRRAAIYFKWEACDKLCYICGLELLIDAVTIDHVHPKARGGDNNIENLMPVHARCNGRKSARLDYPIARPDLVEKVSYIRALPRHPKRSVGKRWAAKHEEYLEMKAVQQSQEAV